MVGVRVHRLLQPLPGRFEDCRLCKRDGSNSEGFSLGGLRLDIGSMKKFYFRVSIAIAAGLCGRVVKLAP